MHPAREIRPDAVVYVPAGHDTQPFPSLKKKPVSQPVQSLTDDRPGATVKVPWAQLVHEEEPIPEEYLPVSHHAHMASVVPPLLVEYLPIPHPTQTQYAPISESLRNTAE